MKNIMISNKNGKYGVEHRKFKPEEELGQQFKVSGNGSSDAFNAEA